MTTETTFFERDVGTAILKLRLSCQVTKRLELDVAVEQIDYFCDYAGHGVVYEIHFSIDLPEGRQYTAVRCKTDTNLLADSRCHLMVDAVIDAVTDFLWSEERNTQHLADQL